MIDDGNVSTCLSSPHPIIIISFWDFYGSWVFSRFFGAFFGTIYSNDLMDTAWNKRWRKCRKLSRLFPGQRDLTMCIELTKHRKQKLLEEVGMIGYWVSFGTKSLNFYHFDPATYLLDCTRAYIRVFWVGPLVGGVLAAIVWETFIRPDQPVKRIISLGSRMWSERKPFDCLYSIYCASVERFSLLVDLAVQIVCGYDEKHFFIDMPRRGHQETSKSSYQPHRWEW